MTISQLIRKPFDAFNKAYGYKEKKTQPMQQSRQQPQQPQPQEETQTTPIEETPTIQTGQSKKAQRAKEIFSSPDAVFSTLDKLNPEARAAVLASPELLARYNAATQAKTELPFVQPDPLSEDRALPGTDALDASKIIGAGIAGATTGAGIGAGVGSVIPVAGTAAGAVTGGIIGGAVAGISAFFYSKSAEEKQYTKEASTNFGLSTKAVQKILNNANAGVGSQAANRAYMDNELARIEQAERELYAQSRQLYGAKLSKNLDELQKIEAWKRDWNRYGALEFQRALIAPDPSRVNFDIAVTDTLQND